MGPRFHIPAKLLGDFDIADLGTTFRVSRNFPYMGKLINYCGRQTYI